MGVALSSGRMAIGTVESARKSQTTASAGPGCSTRSSGVRRSMRTARALTLRISSGEARMGAAADEQGLACKCESTTGDATRPSRGSNGTCERSGRSGCDSERTARGARRTSDLAVKSMVLHKLVTYSYRPRHRSAPLHNFRSGKQIWSLVVKLNTRVPH